MALVAIASSRSPGLTTSGIALAMTWPRPVLLAELDPAGGTIGSVRAANTDPGLKTLAASGRHYLSPGLVTSNLQVTSNGVAVLMAPTAPDRCAAALAALNPVGLGETLQKLNGYDVIADCGRLDSNSPALPVAQQAEAVLFFVRPSLVDILGLRARLETLELREGTPAGIVVVNEGPHRVEDVVAAFTIPVVGVLPWDTRSAAAVLDGRKVPARSALLQSARGLASAVAGQFIANGVAAGDARGEVESSSGSVGSSVPLATPSQSIDSIPSSEWDDSISEAPTTLSIGGWESAR